MCQVAGKLLGRAVHQAVGKALGKGVAGVLGAQQPLAHGQGFQGGRGHHVAGAGIDEDLRPAAAVSQVGRCPLSVSCSRLTSSSRVFSHTRLL